jgi:hypothetical protein
VNAEQDFFAAFLGCVGEFA